MSQHVRRMEAMLPHYSPRQLGANNAFDKLQPVKTTTQMVTLNAFRRRIDTESADDLRRAQVEAQSRLGIKTEPFVKLSNWLGVFILPPPAAHNLFMARLGADDDPSTIEVAAEQFSAGVRSYSSRSSVQARSLFVRVSSIGLSDRKVEDRHVVAATFDDSVLHHAQYEKEALARYLAGARPIQDLPEQPLEVDLFYTDLRLHARGLARSLNEANLVGRFMSLVDPSPVAANFRVGSSQ